MQIRYAELVVPRKFLIRERKLEIDDNHVMVRNAVCGLCQWEVKNHYLGKLGSFPQTLGHEFAGMIEKIGKNVKDWEVNDRVTGLLPGIVKPGVPMEGFATHVAVDPLWLVKIPDNVKLEYALGEPLKCIATITRAANPQFGDYVLIVGCGGMGLLTLAALKGNAPAEMIAVDRHPEKLKLAKEMGASISLNSNECNLEKEIGKITRGHGIDVAIDAAGNPEAVQVASRMLRSRRGKLILAGYHGSPTTYDLDSWCRHGIEVHVPHAHYSFDEMEDLNRAIHALGKGIFPMEKIITHTFKLDDIQVAFETALSKPEGYVKGIITF